MVKTIYMGQFETCRNPDQLRTTLGSCVGIVLFHPGKRLYGMAHILLPKADVVEPTTRGKFADTAVPALLETMGIPKAEFSTVRAKIAGGANMFPNLVTQDVLKVGEKNSETVREILETFGIQVLGVDLGGTKGREFTIDSESGRVWVKKIGESPKEI